MRPIDADTLRAEFTGNFQEMWHYTGIWAMIDLAPTLEDAPTFKTATELSRYWIPIDDMVPSDNRYVLLSFENFNIPAVGRYEEDEDGGGAFFLGDDDICVGNYEMFVNAWMELPACYKGA